MRPTGRLTVSREVNRVVALTKEIEMPKHIADAYWRVQWLLAVKPEAKELYDLQEILRDASQ